MAKPLGVIFRGYRLGFDTLIIVTKFAVALAGIMFFLAWVGLLVEPLPLWLDIYVGVAVAAVFTYFLSRKFVPPTPIVTPKTPCPRCKNDLHYAGWECPTCGVLSFSHDRLTEELEAPSVVEP